MSEHDKDLDLREANGDASAAVVPRNRLSTITPFNGEQIVSKKVDLFYFIPCGEYFSLSAQGFGQVRGGKVENSSRCYNSMINHIFLQAKAIGGDTLDGQPKQYPTWTVVPHKDDPRRYAGYLYRVIYTIPSGEVAKEIDSHLKSCSVKEVTATNHGGNSFFAKPFSQRFTYTEWAYMCEYYLSKVRRFEDRARGLSMIDQPDNPYYPETVFNFANAAAKMKSAHAPPEFYQRSSYLTADEEPRFPEDGQRTHLLMPDQMNVTVLKKTYLPHVGRAPLTFENEEFRAFAVNAGLRVDGDAEMALADGLADMIVDDNDSEAGAGREDVTIDAVMQSFSQLTATGEPESSNTLLGFKARVGKRMARARKEAAGDPQRLAILRREAQKDCITWFFNDIFTTDETADAGDAVRALAGWFKDFLRSNRNFMMPNEKHTKNLSRFGDAIAQEAALGDTVWAIHVAHQEVLSLRMASLHSYFYSPFHCHTALLGEPGSGKSNAFKINNDRLIPGTTRDIGVESGKAKMTPGKKTDLAIETYEDIAPSQVGVSNQMTGKGSTTSNTDAESMLKYRLTKGRMKGVYKAVINGVHTMVEVDSFCNTVMLIGMNAVLTQVPKSISNRFNNIQFQTRTRLGNDGEEQNTSSKFAHGHNPRMTRVKRSAIRRDQRNQVFHAIIQLLVWAEVFELNMAVPWLIWSKVLARAKTKGLQETGEVRHFERLQFHGETLVVADAIGRVLDAGPESPLNIKNKFHMDDILEFEKHLYGNTEHAALALGLLQHQWENPAIHAVEKFFKTVLLKKLIANKATGPSVLNGSPVPAIDQEAAAKKRPDDQHYYMAKIDGLVAHGGLSEQQRREHDIERLQRYASKLMMPCPQPDEVKHALKCLCELQVDVEDPVSHRKHKIPVLDFSPEGDVKVAVQHIATYSKNRMRDCLVHVLSHKYTKEKNFLYGRTKEKNPNIYETVRITPDPNKKLVMEQSSFFSACLLKMTHNAIKGVSAAAYERSADELQEDEATEDHFKELFSDSPHKDVDMDLDDWASKMQAKRIGLEYFPPTADAPGFQTTTDAIMQATMERMGDEFHEMTTYPICFKELQPILYKKDILMDKKKNPEKYSLKASVGEPTRKRFAVQQQPNIEEGEEEKENHQPHAAAAAAAGSEEDDDDGYVVVRDAKVCNSEFFCGDVDEDAEEEVEEQELDEDGDGVIPPPHLLLRGGPDGGALPQGWNNVLHNNSSRFSDEAWDDAIVAAQEAASSGVYQPLPVGVVRANGGRAAAAHQDKRPRFSSNPEE